MSVQGYDELAADGILFVEVMNGLPNAELIEDYPAASMGPSVLVMHRDSTDRPVHAVWGIPKGAMGSAALVTAYRPDIARWWADFRERRK